jgi:Zn-dependent proteases
MIDISPDITKNIARIAVTLVPILLGMVLHELAHGYTAYKLGDPTPNLQGRLTLNPIRHLDVTGSIIFIITALTSPFVFGWAKPVNVQPRYFTNPRKGMMLVSIAGPMANFALAIVFGALYAILTRYVISGQMPITSTVQFFLHTTFMGIWINLTLGWFNLLPIPALDGGHILAALLPSSLAQKFYAYGKYGLIFILVMMVSGVLRHIMQPLVGSSAQAIGSVFSIPPQLLFF